MQGNINFKNIIEQSPFTSSNNLNHKSHKKRRKKNSYTDNFIDRKKLSIESSKGKNKSQKKSPSAKTGKILKNNIITNNKKNINYHIKYQNKPKHTTKTENSKNFETPLIKARNNTNNNSHNLNSNIILINNNNINYSNKNENSSNINDKNILINDNTNEKKELKTDIISNGDLISKNRFKNLLISNISTLTNNISNILSNNEQNLNNNIPKRRYNPYLKSKINEYCYKNKILTNSSNEETYSKGKISTNYNNDLEINISDIKFSRTKKDNKKDNSTKKNENQKEVVKKLKYNDSYYKLSENNVVKIEESKSEIYNNITINNNNNNEEEIKETINPNIDTDKNKKDELNDSEYRIYEVNSINNYQRKEMNDLNVNYFTNISENKTRNINNFLNANIWLENENGKNEKINLDDYINIAKEKLYKIRNSNIDENNTLNKKRIKTTLNYILNKNKNENNKNNEYDLEKNKNNEKDVPINLKANLVLNKNNKYIIKTSNRMMNFLNSNETQKNKLNKKNLSKSKKNNNIPNIKTIADEKIEVFDEEEFLQIKKRNFSTKKTNIKINLDEDFKKLNRNIKYRKNNDIYFDNIGNKTMNEENILPPNNLKLKPILNQNIVKTILKSKVNF